MLTTPPLLFSRFTGSYLLPRRVHGNCFGCPAYTTQPQVQEPRRSFADRENGAANPACISKIDPSVTSARFPHAHVLQARDFAGK
jgi:hypothetical protein